MSNVTRIKHTFKLTIVSSTYRINSVFKSKVYYKYNPNHNLYFFLILKGV
jgi:hypothetical protein